MKQEVQLPESSLQLQYWTDGNSVSGNLSQFY